MAGKIKGITIEIGGNTTKLDKALQASQKQGQNLASELRQIDKLLKFDPGNVELLTQKQKVLSEQVENTSDKLKLLRDAQEQVVEQFERGEIGEEQMRAFQREIASTESYLAKMESQLAECTAEIEKMGQASSAMEELVGTINRQEQELSDLKKEYANVVLEQGKTSDEAQELASRISALNGELNENRSRLDAAENEAEQLTQTLDRAEDAAENAGDGFTIMKGMVSDLASNVIQSAVGAIGDLIGSVFELSEATEEYRIMQGKLSGSAESFGYSMDFVNEKYKQFYTYVSDDQMATNAITNLLGMKVSTETLSSVADGAIAVWTAYGDSIPIESLTESITETVNVSKVTGTLADTINWASLTNEQWTGILGKGTKGQKAFTKAIKEGLPVEDAFSEALAATSDKGERANMVADMLNTTYGKSKDTYDDLSGSILDANAAEIELKETQAELGKTLEPVNTSLTRLKNDALKALTPVIRDATLAFEDMISGVDWDDAAADAGEFLDTAVDGLTWIADHSDGVTSAITGLVTAWVAYKAGTVAATAATTTANAALTISEAVTARATAGTIAHTAATKGAAVAQKALNLIQAASPIGLIVTALAGAGVALAAYASKTKEVTAETSANTEETKKLISEYKELNSQLESNRKQRDDTIESIGYEYDAADRMAAKMDQLAEKENKSNAEKALMKQYVDQLNEIMPELNLQYDEEADKLNMSTDAIRNNIQASKELALAKAAQENLAKIAQDQVEAEIKLADLQQQLTVNEEDYREAKKKSEKAFDDWVAAGQLHHGEMYETMLKASDAEEQAEENYKKTKKAVKDLTGEVDSLNKEYDETEKFAENALNAAEIEKALAGIVEACKAKGVEIPESVSEGIRAGNYLVPQSVEEMQALITFDSLAQKAKDGGIKIPENLSQGLANGQISIQTAIDQMNNLITFDSLVQKATDSGYKIPTSLSDGVMSGQTAPQVAVQQMNNLITFDDLLSKSSAAGTKVPQYVTDGVISGQMNPQQAVQAMKDLVTFNDLVDKAKKAGYDVPAEIKKNVKNNETTPQKAIQQMKNLIEFNDLLAKSSAAGKDVPKKIQDGVLSGKMSPKQAVDEMNRLMVNAANSKKGEMKKAGTDNATSVQQGLASKNSNVKNAGSNLGSNGVSGIRSTRGEFYDAGSYVAQGIESGSQSRNSNIFSAMWSLGKGMVNKFLGAINAHSPSREFMTASSWIPAGIEVGVEKNKDGAINSVVGLANDMIDAFTAYESRSIGEEFANEFAAGISSSDSPAKALRSLTNDMIDTKGINGVTLNRQIEHTFATPSSGGSIAELTALMARYMPELIKVSQHAILLDGDTLVGETIHRIDNGLAQVYRLKERGM